MASTALERLRELETLGRLGGGQARIERQHAKGKYTARERLDILLDPGTFQETDAFARQGEDGVPGDSVVTGWGEIAGRPVYVY
ncbi:MAG: methylmalonyl-CoA carboxyltransferase, partial [Gammaproteobacteria bacterium]